MLGRFCGIVGLKRDTEFGGCRQPLIWVVPSLDVRYPHLGRCQCSYWVCIDRVDEARVRNVFLLYMPPGNREAIVHYQDTIVNRVALERVRPFVSDNLR